MPLNARISADNLMSLEDYAKWRKLNQPQIMAHRKLRSVRVGEHLNLQFEDEATVRYQIQEMLRIEKTFEPEGIVQEVQAYAPLVPDGHNWKGTLLIEYVQVQGHDPVYAIADEDLDRENAEKTSAVHFVRFELTPAMCASAQSGAGVRVGCDHAHYQAHTDVAGSTLASLVNDLS